MCKSWSNFQLSGWKAFVLKDKLKALKGVLKSWNYQVFGTIETHIASLREEVRSLDLRIHEGGLSVEEIDSRKNVTSDIWSLLHIRDAQLL